MKYRSENGSFTIEAIMSLTMFMFGFLAITSLATIAKVESTTQYAIDQVAKEISQYYYIADRVGVANTDGSGIDEIDGAIQAVFDFTNKSQTDATDEKSIATTATDLANTLSSLTGVGNNVDDVAAAAANIYASYGPALEDPKGLISALATAMVTIENNKSAVATQVANEVITKVIAQPLCRALLPKYITADGDADAVLEKMGVVDGLEGMDFRMSSFLSDNRSINVVVVYEIKVNGFGIFDDTLVIKQTASTAAWVSGTSLKAANDSVSTWAKDSFQRGKDFVNELQKDNPTQAVKAGVGVDLYDQSTNTFTSVHSLNVFAASYSEFVGAAGSESDADLYTLQKSKIKSAVKSYANKLNKNVGKIDDSITMESGAEVQTAWETVQHRNKKIVLVVPEEAKTNSDNLAVLNQIASEIKAETGVEVSITYRDKALE